MLIFDPESRPIIIDSLSGPIVPDYMWVLDVQQRDFCLAPITMIEETICSSVLVCINGFEFVAPANWHILVYDRETSQLDAIDIASASGHEFTALVYGPRCSRPSPGVITVHEYYPEYKNVGPSLTKTQMLCHPISPIEWISMGPTDNYKHLRDIIVGDLIN
jgi:hypothetical protein